MEKGILKINGFQWCAGTLKMDIIRFMYIGHRIYRMKIAGPLESDIREVDSNFKISKLKLSQTLVVNFKNLC
jgi:hypothetical protein